MELNHCHVLFREFMKAKIWFERTLEKEPIFQNHRLAYFDLGSMTLVIEDADTDTKMTLAFRTASCDQRFKELVAEGNEVIEEPTTRPWKVRSAYLKGPGSLTLEIEQQILEEA
ncbi:MAG: hypothetical protein HRU19_00940 [Pseudobacteriovorax sp.]|nr:hypothetical protein [Pseudobacteriovorax sp.]